VGLCLLPRPLSIQLGKKVTVDKRRKIHISSELTNDRFRQFFSIFLNTGPHLSRRTLTRIGKDRRVLKHWRLTASLATRFARQLGSDCAVIREFLIGETLNFMGLLNSEITDLSAAFNAI